MHKVLPTVVVVVVVEVVKKKESWLPRLRESSSSPKRLAPSSAKIILGVLVDVVVEQVRPPSETVLGLEVWTKRRKIGTTNARCSWSQEGRFLGVASHDAFNQSCI